MQTVGMIKMFIAVSAYEICEANLMKPIRNFVYLYCHTSPKIMEGKNLKYSLSVIMKYRKLFINSNGGNQE